MKIDRPEFKYPPAGCENAADYWFDLAYEYELYVRQQVQEIWTYIEHLEQRQTETTTVSPIGVDEAYCDWFRCDNCGCAEIHDSGVDFTYCPGCGRKLTWR